jgi:hypothetical protein
MFPVFMQPEIHDRVHNGTPISACSVERVHYKDNPKGSDVGVTLRISGFLEFGHRLEF